jgi:2-keto-4-pentenoate hydratase/2-oxohepta-3-ene-1,7-dioic acid hydratase in catechol pathway
MIHGLPDLIADITRTITLEPGDLILTGTPAGVGCYRTPRRWLTPGEVVECRISGPGVDLGCLANPVELR